MCAVLSVEQMSYKTLQRTSSDTHTKKSKFYSNVWSDSLNVTTCCCGFIYHSANISRNYWHINGHTPYRLPCCVPGHSTQLHNLLCSWTHSQGMCWSQCMIQNSSKSRVVRFISWSEHATPNLQIGKLQYCQFATQLSSFQSSATFSFPSSTFPCYVKKYASQHW